jgi:hypothetical protein
MLDSGVRKRKHSLGANIPFAARSFSYRQLCRSARLSTHPETMVPAALKIPDDADQLEVHRFAFRLVHGQCVAHAESVSLRTAKALVKDLEIGNPFVRKF